MRNWKDNASVTARVTRLGGFAQWAIVYSGQFLEN
jgi:hypothetical protein